MILLTAAFYLLVGAATAVAILVRREGGGPGERAFLAATAVVFWPVHLPVLLATAPAASAARAPRSADERDAMGRAIAGVQRGLVAAFADLDGWAGEALDEESSRIGELCDALRGQAARVREMDRVLGGVGGDDEAPDAPGRRENYGRLAEVRDRTREELFGTLAWIRELVSMIHLARFTGAPASRAEELVREIASAVEGLSEASAIMTGVPAGSGSPRRRS